MDRPFAKVEGRRVGGGGLWEDVMADVDDML